MSDNRPISDAMSVTLLGRPRVPAEFTGLARVFRNAVQTEDRAFDKAVGVIAKPLRARLRHHTKLRHEIVSGAVRLYRLIVPSGFRIGDVGVAPDREAFAIREARLGVTLMNAEAWGNPDYGEPGVTVARFSLSLHQGRLRERWTPVAIVSLHSLARRLERHHDRSHAALVADLALLLDAAHGDAVEAPTALGSAA
jgi:hypothetical protein